MTEYSLGKIIGAHGCVDESYFSVPMVASKEWMARWLGVEVEDLPSGQIIDTGDMGLSVGRAVVDSMLVDTDILRGGLETYGERS